MRLRELAEVRQEALDALASQDERAELHAAAAVGARLDVDPNITERTGYRERSGVVVENVRAGSPAERVGFERGDLVTQFGERHLHSLEDVLVQLQFTESGTAFEVKFVRRQRSRFGVNYERWKARVVAD